MKGTHKSQFYISAAHKSSGKTVISLGLCALVRESGLTVQPFKKGPDYIDPLWLGRASQNNCVNLDFNTQSPPSILDLFLQYSLQSDVSIVEGNKGLHDGVAIDGSDCNSELANLLSIPVILVIDTQGTTRGIAPLLLGYQAFDSRIDIAGVILNKVAGSRHEEKLRLNVETHTDITVLGAVPRESGLVIKERHLGLIPSSEFRGTEQHIKNIAQLVRSSVNVETILTATRAKSRIETRKQITDNTISRFPEPDIRIGIPRDRAFGFYYPDDLTALRRAGCELCFFDTLKDTAIPGNIDGLFIGGGFPEIYMSELEANFGMRESVSEFIADFGPTYAECGGLMYLGQSIRWDDLQADMVGALPVSSEMTCKPVGRGYVQLEETGLSPLGSVSEGGGVINAHEFHYSKIKILDENEVEGFAYRVKRGWGLDGKNDGLIFKNVLASYSHLRNVSPVNWADQYSRFVRKISHRRKREEKIEKDKIVRAAER